MVLTDIYPNDKFQMRHCGPCDMPEALQRVSDDTALYSVVKHAIVETKLAWGNEDSLDQMRAAHEDQGTVPIFEAALKCIRCAEGMCLLISGEETPWSVGGNQAV